MKTLALLTVKIVLLLLLAVAAQAAEPTTKLYSRSGSKMRIEGSSNIHDWQMENTVIQGLLEVGSDFPLEPGQAATAGKVEARADISVSVKGFRSYKKDGSPYDPAMDDRMCQALKAEENPKVSFHLTELVLKQPAATKDAPYLFEAKGELAVAGVTNTISMPVNVQPLGGAKLKISGTAAVKMTDFKIDPPTKLGVFKTENEVKLIFGWMVAPRTTPAAPAGSK